MIEVSPSSTSLPKWKKAVRCETRAACCIEWVTITMVKFCRSSSMSSSIRAVAMGSRAEAGSSIRITSGLMAIARAMQRRCCPPEAVPGREAVLHLVPQPRLAERFLDDRVEIGPAAGQAVDASP